MKSRSSAVGAGWRASAGVAVVLLLAAAFAQAQVTSSVEADERTASQWLQRMHSASQERAYVGTLVVASDQSLSTSRIWHVCDGKRQLERVETLSGPKRSTFRNNDEVITFSPATKVAIRERRESLGLFPHLLASSQSQIDAFYQSRVLGRARIAGFDTDVVQLLPRDRLRFGYRIWSESESGLVIKMQVLDRTGRVLEQVGYSELDLNAPVSADKLVQMMNDTEGYRVQAPVMHKTEPAREGWRLRSEVPGFSSVAGYRRHATDAASREAATVQWIFSDGLATVSVFIEAADETDARKGALRHGATHALSVNRANGGRRWQLTLVGEVPLATLRQFARNLEYSP